ITLAALDRQMLAERHTLNALLGLAPDVVLPLASRAVVPPLDPQAVRRALPALAQHRPDLVALRYGYQAQEEKVRAAIIGQFPNLLLGIAYGRDNTNDYSIGPQPSGDIPIFDRNQGNIAIERA
ncbi:TolC family protein, partial [Acidisphaera rubrifaciens]|uniref:TolC family protein n=1 Tax=Acidisphaera rubrifaciens TaxID=50715 RepID=UPI000662205F